MTAGEDRMKLLKLKIHFFLAIIVCIVGLTIGASSQATPTPPSTPAPETKPKIKIKPSKIWKSDLPPNVERGEGTTTERAIAVDPRVSLDLCITEGNVKINGWKRSEVRAFVENGSRFAFRVGEKSADSGKPVLISLVGVRQLGNASTMPCGRRYRDRCPRKRRIHVKRPRDGY
jgi:hypothetical protein